jgi:hypothetical protein
MPIQTGIVALLAADAGVQAAIGTAQSRLDGSNGIFPSQAPQGADTPLLVYNRISGLEMDSLDGPGELFQSRIQISSFSARYSDVDEATAAAFAALVGFTGRMPDGTTDVDAIKVENLMNDVFDSTLKVYQAHFDVVVWWRNVS